MSTEENKAVVRRFFELFEKGDLDGIEALLDPNCTVYRAGMPPLSRDTFKQHGAMLATAFTDHKVTTEDIFAENDMVCYRGTWSATHHGDFIGIPATGKRVTIGFIVINRVANGKIIENWEEMDKLGMMQQLGVIPSPQMD